MRGVLTALAYVEVRTAAGRIRRSLRNPLTLIGIVVGLGAVVWTQLINPVDPSAFQLGESLREVGVAIVAGVLGGSALVGVSTCPIRLRGPDIAWLVPRRGGVRAIVAAHLAMPAARMLLIGLPWILLIGAISPNPPLWGGVVAVALIGVVVRVHGALVHLIALRGAARVWQVVVPSAWLGVAVTATLDAGRLPGPVELVASWVRRPLEVLVGAVAAPLSGAPGVGAVAVGIVALGIGTVALGTRWQDGAAQRTWESEAVTAALRDGTMTGEVMSQAIDRQVRRGIPSLGRDLGLHGEWALVWRGVAGLRRTWRPIGWMVGGAVAVATGLAVFAPDLAWLPTAVVAAWVTLMPQTGLLEERGHLALFRIPGSAVRRAIAVDVLPITYLSLTVVLVAAPWLGPTAPGVLVGLAVAAPFVVSGIVAVGGAAVLSSGSMAKAMLAAIAQSWWLSWSWWPLAPDQQPSSARHGLEVRWQGWRLLCSDGGAAVDWSAAASAPDRLWPTPPEELT